MSIHLIRVVQWWTCIFIDIIWRTLSWELFFNTKSRRQSFSIVSKIAQKLGVRSATTGNQLAQRCKPFGGLGSLHHPPPHSNFIKKLIFHRKATQMTSNTYKIYGTSKTKSNIPGILLDVVFSLEFNLMGYNFISATSLTRHRSLRGEFAH